MKIRNPLLAVAVLLALGLLAPAAIAQDDDDDGNGALAPGRTPAQGALPGQYIVVLDEEVRYPTAVAREHAQRHGAQVLHTYRHALEGYAARIPTTDWARCSPRSG